MNDVYIIINNTALQNRIEELEKDILIFRKNGDKIPLALAARIRVELQDILSQSTPLVPEIEKAIDYGIRKSFGSKKHSEIRQEYISNLKLDI